jgi:hypothetical protein
MQVTKHTDHFATAPQLAPEHMPALAQHGFHTVINNRPDMEGGPDQPTSAQMQAAAEAAAADEIEMEEGESLEEMKARMQSMKPKKPTFTADMLDTANTYDDKVALIRMLVAQESGRVALVLKNLVKN